jgi:predicted transcriptional regulator
MPKQMTVRLPDELADQAEAVARVRGTSVNQLVIESLLAEIERVRRDEAFTAQARHLIEQDRKLLERLAR